MQNDGEDGWSRQIKFKKKIAKKNWVVYSRLLSEAEQLVRKGKKSHIRGGTLEGGGESTEKKKEAREKEESNFFTIFVGL